VTRGTAPLRSSGPRPVLAEPVETVSFAMRKLLRLTSWRPAAAVLGVWTVFGVLESSKAYVADQLQGIPRGWGPALIGNMPWWWAWAALTPLVFLLASRIRLDRLGWPAALGLHLVLGAIISGVHLAAVGVLYWHTITRPVLAYLPGSARDRLATPLGQVEAFLNGYLIVDVMTYAAIVTAWYALRFHRTMREREGDALAERARAATLEAQMQEARLSALRMELNPHFLYNALNAIAGLVRRGDQAQAVEMLARLGTLLRLTLDRNRGHEATLGGELDLLDLYLAIERTRRELRVSRHYRDALLKTVS
jgi:two-component system, LytTR family, sensor kinase